VNLNRSLDLLLSQTFAPLCSCQLVALVGWGKMPSLEEMGLMVNAKNGEPKGVDMVELRDHDAVQQSLTASSEHSWRQDLQQSGTRNDEPNWRQDPAVVGQRQQGKRGNAWGNDAGPCYQGGSHVWTEKVDRDCLCVCICFFGIWVMCCEDKWMEVKCAKCGVKRSEH
jgi:hypothetical protein